MESRKLILLIGVLLAAAVGVIWLAARRRSRLHECEVCHKRVRVTKGRCAQCGTPIMFSLIRQAAKPSPKKFDPHV
jgi:predicted amidophosphoribosyltransferase